MRGWVCRLQLLLVSPAQSFLDLSSTHFTDSDSRLPQPGGPGPRIYIPQNRVARLYPQALASLFIAWYDSQGYGGGIWPASTRYWLKSQSYKAFIEEDPGLYLGGVRNYYDMQTSQI
jgi:hypothetical protein